MGRGEYCGGDPLAAAEIAPRELLSPRRGLDPGDERHMIEPSRRQHRFEVPQIRDIGCITVIFSRHLFIDITTERMETTEKGSPRGAQPRLTEPLSAK